MEKLESTLITDRSGKDRKPYTHFEALVLLFKMGMGFAMFGATVAEKFERTVEVGGRIAQNSTIRWNFSAAAAPNIANHILILKPCIVALECGAARLNLLHGYHVMAVGAQAASGPSNGH